MKDKDQLLEYRRLIETKMEAFKVVEKETKTKTFSKEGLARAEKLDPEEQKRNDTIEWIGEIIDQLQTLIDEKDLEIEKLSSGKGKKTNKNQIEDCNQHLLSHKFHMSKLEGIMRLVRNDRIPAETVDEVKEDLEYYIESHEDVDYMMAYDEDCFYEALQLDDLDVVNVDRVTQASTSTKTDDSQSASSSSKKEKNTKKAASSGMIPLTIGRARKSKSQAKEEERGLASNEATPTKLGRSGSNASSGPAPVVAPTPKAPAATGGASMAAVLKRESEERERQKAQLAAAQAQAQQQQAEQARQAAELLRQQQVQAEVHRQQQEAEAKLLLQQQQQQAQQQAEAMKRQQMEQVAAAQAAQQDAVAKQQQQQQQQQAAAQAQQQQNVLGLSGLSLGNTPVAAPASQSQPSSTPAPGTTSSNKDATERYLNALNDSFLQMPTNTETDRAKSYTPRNPYPAAPSCYPTTPSPIFDNPAVFEKLGTDALFFIFYYAQGTYQQYLAARELKKQSWRYHKKYMTWFQRHEEPKVTTDDYEQGTYVYFDYETGWCQRIKSDFRFEYSFLEDSLSVWSSLLLKEAVVGV